MLLSSLLVLVVIATVQSVAVPKSHVVHEKRDDVASSHWMKRDKLPLSVILPMRIGLKQQNLHLSQEFLMGVSHPESPNYGKHWTPHEVIEKFAPEQETVDEVMEWLTKFGIHQKRITHSENKIWLAFDVTVDEADSLLHTEYYEYEHTSSGQLSPACDSYHIPKHIQKHIDYITPGIKLLAAKKRSQNKRGFSITAIKSDEDQLGDSPRRPFENSKPNSAAGPLAMCDKFITPDCVRALYGVPETPEYPNGTPRTDNSLGIFEQGDYYAQEDFDLFFGNFTLNIPQGTHPIHAFINGAEAPTNLNNAGGESALDFELAYSLVYPQTTTLYQTEDSYYALSPDTSGGFNTFLDALDGSYCNYSAFGQTGNDPDLDPVYPNPNPNGYQGELMCGVYKPTNVISVSYGGQESDLPPYYQARQCNEFLKLGLQGISVLYASGDDGVAGPPFGSPNGCLGPKDNIFSPTFPNSCPWLTNVGATKVYPGHTVYDPESAVVDPKGEPYSRAYSSGGGFSNIYEQPEYQRAAIDDYFANHNPPYKSYEGMDFGADDGIYNRIGRGYPDVAANGDNIVIYYGGKLTNSGGTSASTPIFASLVNRINEQRLNAGKSTVGFINPALYLNPSMLNDITNGTNPGCGTDGFSAVPGWDPVTGLGTPNYPKMVDYFMSLP